MLVLRDLVGIEPLGGVYRALVGRPRGARGMLRGDARDDLPGFKPADYLDDEAFWAQVETAARAGARRRRPDPARRRRARPARRRVPDVVRPLDDVPGGARVMNEQQLAAVAARGEVFVSAGAGTGKTTVLVERFVRAVCDDGLDVESVLVITYTRKAAAELRARIRAALLERGRPDLARQLDGAWISTIHGFCARLLRAHPFAVGIDPRFRELDDEHGAVIRGEAFDRALAAFCATRDARAAPAARDLRHETPAHDADRRLRDAALGRPAARARARARRPTSPRPLADLREAAQLPGRRPGGDRAAAGRGARPRSTSRRCPSG